MPDKDDELRLTGEGAGASQEVRAFAHAEMVGCESCLRANPPTRMNCLYCGAALPVDATAGEDLRRPTLRALESWEQGFNVVLAPDARGELSVDSLTEAAALLRLEAGHLRGMGSAPTPLPLARAATREEAELLERKLRAHGWPVEIVPDETLGVETDAPKRIRRLEFGVDALAGWTSAESEGARVAWESLTLLVAGRIARKRIEVEERRSGGRRAQGEIVETRELYDDESALDLYATGARAGWRILAENFDYSCLGAAKSLTAAENFKRLIETLCERAPRAAYDDSYRGVRHYLKFAWPLAEQTEAGSLKRIRPGRYNAEAVTSVTNETQFTRYGRLLQYFRLRALSTTT